MVSSEKSNPKSGEIQRWRKLGCIFTPSKPHSWMSSHASVPIAEKLDSNRVRVIFSSRDEHSRSTVGSFILSFSPKLVVTDVSPQPLLAAGELGTFDDSGTMASWLIRRGNEDLLYYIGWNLGVTVPFRNSIGVAVRNADGTFERCFPGPIVDRTATEPHFCASCCVLPDGAGWQMWYLNCVGWDQGSGGAPRHRYHIKHARSLDGISWKRDGVVAIDFKDASEYAISRPCVVREGNQYRMWYSVRGAAYRIGYAESRDGVSWTRLDNRFSFIEDAVDNDSSEISAWDSEMQEYPFVFELGNQWYLLYNGNGYGKTGIGLAILEDQHSDDQ